MTELEKELELKRLTRLIKELEVNVEKIDERLLEINVEQEKLSLVRTTNMKRIEDLQGTIEQKKQQFEEVR